jgi:hypothetical protein
VSLGDSRVQRAFCFAIVVAALLVPGCNQSTPHYDEPRFVAAAPEGVSHRLLLIGDTGHAEHSSDPPWPALIERAAEMPQQTTIAVLGDLIYEHGLPAAASEERGRAEIRIAAQVDAIRRSGANSLFVPGNHDWDSSGPEGWERVRALEAYLRATQAKGARVSLQPTGGCPGPIAITPAAGLLRLIVLDTEWWLHAYAKPSREANPTACACTTETETASALEAALIAARAAGDHAVILAHHPLKGNGVHAGFSDWKMHVFPFTALSPDIYVPLPLLGSIMPILRVMRSPLLQDMTNPAYRNMIGAIEGAITSASRQGAAPLAYAAGHDHHLEVQKDDTFGYHLISGHGSNGHNTVVSYSDSTLFSHSSRWQPGFMQIDFYADRGARLAVVESTGPDSGIEMYSRWMD